mmetsp:Transcript_21322/g.52850  ORF Transcript_21322/g.52850 Transcript_21322/m.52850 type:complete len:202 (-) Transcript_21322:1194-1799(-)
MGEPRLADRRRSASSIEPPPLYKSRTCDGLADRPLSLFPPSTVTDSRTPPGVLVEKEAVGPFPKEFVGDIPNMAPPDMEAFSLKVPLEDESCKQLSAEEEGLLLPEVLSSKLAEEFSMAESRAPLTLKNCAVSPKLSKDWLNKENEGAISREFVNSGGGMLRPAGPAAWLLGLRWGSKSEPLLPEFRSFGGSSGLNSPSFA